MSAAVLVAKGVRTRTQCLASERQETALELCRRRPRHSSLASSVAPRSTPACMQHLIAPISCCLQAKPTNISRHHCQPLFFFLLISHYTKHFTPNPPSRKHTLPHALYLPPSTIHHRPDPRLPVPDTSSCDSTTARLTTPTLPLQPITSIWPICQPPAVPTHRSTSLRRTSPPLYTSYQPSHLSNRPSKSQGPQQQQQQPAIATPLYLTANDTQNTTYARIEIAESVENPVADATISSAASR